MSDAPPTERADRMALPAWAVVSDRRRSHIHRVTALLERWAADMRLDEAERTTWRDAGLLHDALRDADDATLRALAGETFGTDAPVEILHGPAAAERLRREGEGRADLLDAVRYHTVGHGGWDRVGQALYMADFLEPGRKFMQVDRGWLAAQVPNDFTGVFRQVVRLRLEWSLREGKQLYPSTVALWNAVHG
jgi:HD superfamily phosphohydrolase YqeK